MRDSNRNIHGWTGTGGAESPHRVGHFPRAPASLKPGCPPERDLFSSELTAIQEHLAAVLHFTRTEVPTHVGVIGRAALLVMVVLIAGAGLCFLDADHGSSGDLCVSAVVSAIGLLLTFPLAPTGRLLPARVLAYHLYPPDLPAPPPRA